MNPVSQIERWGFLFDTQIFNFKMKDFTEEIKKALSAATSYGVMNVPKSGHLKKRSLDGYKQQKKFIAGCHRGYEKAQNSIIRLINKIKEDKSIPKLEKVRREFICRRVIDTIAFIILDCESHVARRLVLHRKPPNIDLMTINKVKKEVDKLNSESRMTFALLCDLSTFIHIADILRIDFRQGSLKVSYIELKSGKINEMLLDKLEDYLPKPESIKLLKEDQGIENKYIAQAERILKQKIRIEQIHEVLKTDKGTDILFNQPIILVGSNRSTEDYDFFVDQLCEEAFGGGNASGTVDNCVHIGIGYSDDLRKAKKTANMAATYASFKFTGEAPQNLKKIMSRLSNIMDKDSFLRAWDVFQWSLYGMSALPFPLWNIDRKHIYNMIEGKMVIVSIFNLPGFMYQAHEMGIEATMTSRKEAETYNRKDIPRWDNRCLKFKISHGDLIMSGGIIHRFILNFQLPTDMIKKLKSDYN